MMSNSQERNSTAPYYYGWYIMAASFIILFFNSGARSSFGVLFKPMIAELGWNRSSISLAFFLNMIFFAISIIVSGKLYDRYGPKWVITISTVFISSGYLLIFFVDFLWQFYICYGILAAIGMGGTSVPLFAALISKWFTKWRGLIISLTLSGNCLGQFVLIPLFSLFALRYGWRTTYLLIGLIMFAVNIALTLLVIKKNPDDLSQKPYGREDDDKMGKISETISLREAPGDLGLRDAMRTNSFWFFSLVMFICGSGDFLVTTHLVPFVTDQGISSTTASNMLAWFGLMGLAGILIAGPLSDLIGNKIPIALTFLLRFMSFILILYDQSLTSSYIFALTFGFTFLITAPLSTTLIGRIYGFSHIGLITGFINTIHFLGGGFWTYLGGWIFDQTGSYRLAFILSAITALVAFVSSLLITEKKAIPPKIPKP
jgi:MFS family permease